MLKHIFPALMTFLLIWDSSQAQPVEFDWVQTQNSPGFDLSRDVVVDFEGNVVHVFYFEGLVDMTTIDGGVVQLASVGLADAAVAKYNAEGDVLWVRQFGGLGNDVPQAVATDESGNIFITGWFESDVDFDPGSDIFGLTPFGGKDAFITKMDVNGNFIHAVQIGGKDQGTASSDYESSESIAVDSEGNILVTGSFIGTADFDPGADSLLIESQGSWDCFVLKLDSELSLKWVKPLGSKRFVRGFDVHVGPNDEILCAGAFEDTMAIISPFDSLTLIADGFRDGFVCKMTSNGDFEWASSFQSNATSQAHCVYVHDNQVIVGGYFRSELRMRINRDSVAFISNGYSDIFLANYSLDGHVNYVKTMGGELWDKCEDLVVSESGQIIMTGDFEGTVDFDPGEDEFTLKTKKTTEFGNGDAFLASYSLDGKFNWSGQFGGGDVQEGRSLALGLDNRIYTAGSYHRETVDFDPGSGAKIRPCKGRWDAFLVSVKASILSTSEFTKSVFHIAPNPAINEFQIQIDERLRQLHLLDYYGNKIAEWRLTSQNCYKIPGHIRTGTYLVHGITESGLALSIPLIIIPRS